MAKLIVANNNKCKCCSQVIGWSWRIEAPLGNEDITIINYFAFKTKEKASDSGKVFAEKLGVIISEVDYKPLK